MADYDKEQKCIGMKWKKSKEHELITEKMRRGENFIVKLWKFV